MVSRRVQLKKENSQKMSEVQRVKSISTAAVAKIIFIFTTKPRSLGQSSTVQNKDKSQTSEKCSGKQKKPTVARALSILSSLHSPLFRAPLLKIHVLHSQPAAIYT